MGANGSTGNYTVAADILVVVAVCAVFILGLYLLTSSVKLLSSKFDDRIMKALKRRRTTEDTFREKNGYSWDYMIAFKVYEELEPNSELQAQFNMRYVLGQLSLGGLEFRLFYSLNHQEVFCKIRCPLETIEKHADLLNFKFLIDPDSLKKQLQEGKEGLWEPVLTIPEVSPLTTISPYDFIYARYEIEEECAHLYKRWPKKTLNSGDNSNPDQLRWMNSSSDYDGQPVTINNPLSSVRSNQKEEIKVVYDSVFKGMDRLKIINSIITYYGPGGCYLNPSLLVEKKCLLCYTPLHDIVEIRELEMKWIVFLQFPWSQPVDEVRNYFGEKIGLYFAWLGAYTSWLIIAAVVGTGIWINIAVDNNNPNVASIPYFCGFMGLWSSLFLEYWKRQEKTIALKWGMIGFEDEERVRPTFDGIKMRSPINGAPDIYFSKWQRLKRSFRAYSIVIGSSLSIIGIVASIFVIKAVLNRFTPTSEQMVSILAGLMLAIMIQILNKIFGNYALSLNEYENHRTDTEFEDALILKTFIFQFFNSYSALFYIAFAQPFMFNIDPSRDCMVELQITLATIFIARLLLGNFEELVWPLIISYMKSSKRESLAVDLRRQSEKFHRNHQNNSIDSQSGDFLSFDGSGDSNRDEIARNEISEIEKTYMMPEYHVMLGTLEDYAEMAIQFGYTTMFVAAFPLSCLMALINNYVEIRVDAWKLCQLCRRPEPRSCEDIGTWQIVLELVSYASVFCNSAIIAYTTTTSVNYTWAERAWIFILIGTGLLLIKFFVAYMIPDIPEEIDIQQKRQEYFVKKIIDNVDDEDDSGLVKGLYVPPTYIVNVTDDDPL